MCYYCMDTGMVRYYKKGLMPFSETEYEFVARCECEKSEKYNTWPQFKTVVKPDECDWLWNENMKKHGNVTHDEKKKAKTFVQSFVRSI